MTTFRNNRHKMEFSCSDCHRCHNCCYYFSHPVRQHLAVSPPILSSELVRHHENHRNVCNSFFLFLVLFFFLQLSCYPGNSCDETHQSVTYECVWLRVCVCVCAVLLKPLVSILPSSPVCAGCNYTRNLPTLLNIFQPSTGTCGIFSWSFSWNVADVLAPCGETASALSLRYRRRLLISWCICYSDSL